MSRVLAPSGAGFAPDVRALFPADAALFARPARSRNVFCSIQVVSRDSKLIRLLDKRDGPSVLWNQVKSRDLSGSYTWGLFFIHTRHDSSLVNHAAREYTGGESSRSFGGDMTPP